MVVCVVVGAAVSEVDGLSEVEVLAALLDVEVAVGFAVLVELEVAVVLAVVVVVLGSAVVKFRTPAGTECHCWLLRPSMQVHMWMLVPRLFCELGPACPNGKKKLPARVTEISPIQQTNSMVQPTRPQTMEMEHPCRYRSDS